MPKCIELLPCDWLISNLCYQAIEQVYLIKWPVSVCVCEMYVYVFNVHFHLEAQTMFNFMQMLIFIKTKSQNRYNSDSL